MYAGMRPCQHRAGSGTTRNRVAGETELTPTAAVKPRAERSNGFVWLRAMIVGEVIVAQGVSNGRLEAKVSKIYIADSDRFMDAVLRCIQEY